MLSFNFKFMFRFKSNDYVHYVLNFGCLNQIYVELMRILFLITPLNLGVQLGPIKTLSSKNPPLKFTSPIAPLFLKDWLELDLEHLQSSAPNPSQTPERADQSQKIDPIGCHKRAWNVSADRHPSYPTQIQGRYGTTRARPDGSA